MTSWGLVSLVGAGPGDPELMTLRGVDRLAHADVVVYDRLIDPRILEHVPPEAERVFVGKGRGFSRLDQRGIEAILIERARAGKRVVRLKGGDPYVFGRGGEEVEALATAGVPYEVVPGITSAIAAPAAAGIPVTHRGLSSSVTIVTGHEDPSEDGAVDWSWIAAGSGTVVILMGLEHLRATCRRLLEGGRPTATPAAVVSAGTWPQQRGVFALLAELPDAVERAGLPSPATIVVGEVVSVAETVAALTSANLAQAV